jgi:hypothetical protein
MEAKRQGGRGYSGPVLRQILLFFFLLGTLLFGATDTAFATATLAVKLPKLPGATQAVLIFVRSVEAETGRVLGIVSLKKQSSQVQLKVDAVPQIVFADLFTSEGNKLSAHSSVLRTVDRKKLTVTLQGQSNPGAAPTETTGFPGGSFPPSADAPSPPVDMGRVGVPSSGFTIEGIDQQAAGIASMVTTDIGEAPCYDKEGGFVVIVTDHAMLEAIQAEIDLSNSTWADPSTRLQNLYVPPSYFINGSVVSDGTTLTITYRLVDSEGNELLSKSDAGPADKLFDISTSVAKDLADSMCCKSKKLKCAKTGSIDIDVDYDILHPDCPTDHQSILGNITFSLLPALTDPQNVCEYVGSGISYFKSDAECVEGLFQHVTCAVTETIKGKVPKPAFPFCNNLVVDFVELWDCIEVDPVGTHPYTSPAAWTQNFKYANGFVVDYPLLSPFTVGHDRMILHLK